VASIKQAMKQQVCPVSAWACVPFPIVLYAWLSLCDLGLTLAAFVLGATEANPMLAWFYREGLFEFTKLTSTLLVSCVAFRLWSEPRVRRLVTLANVLMALVLAYHGFHWMIAQR
jgi:hypothetical protein